MCSYTSTPRLADMPPEDARCSGQDLISVEARSSSNLTVVASLRIASHHTTPLAWRNGSEPWMQSARFFFLPREL